MGPQQTDENLWPESCCSGSKATLGAVLYGVHDFRTFPCLFAQSDSGCQRCRVRLWTNVVCLVCHLSWEQVVCASVDWRVVSSIERFSSSLIAAWHLNSCLAAGALVMKEQCVNFESWVKAPLLCTVGTLSVAIAPCVFETGLTPYIFIIHMSKLLHLTCCHGVTRRLSTSCRPTPMAVASLNACTGHVRFLDFYSSKLAI